MLTTKMRWTAIGTAAVLTLAACGSSDGEGAGSDAFCEQVRILDADDSVAEDDLAAVAEQFEELIDEAPEELRDDLRVVIDAFAELDAIDENDPDSFALLFEIAERPEFVEASENLERFGVEECGLEPSSDGEIDGDGPDIVLGEPADTAPDSGGAGEVKTTTVPGDPYDEEFWGPIEADQISIPGLEQYLDVNYPDEGWYDGSINGWSTGGTNDIGVDAEVDVDEALRICAAILEYASPIEPDVRVTVNDSAAAELVVGSVADGCLAA